MTFDSRLAPAVALALGITTAACGADTDETAPADAGPSTGTVATDPNLRVAFIGDQGLGPDAEAVLQLISDEGADLVIHSGDFDYEDDPVGWNAQIDGVLGADYPYFAAIGNHDVDAWDGYQSLLEERLARIDGAQCTGGDLGIRSACRYRGLFFLLSGVGTWGFFDHLAYLAEELDGDDSIWRVCAWHKNHEDFQVGDKESETSLRSYDTCAARRAVIATAHEHSYGRTRTLTDVDNTAAGYGATGDPEVLEVSHGSTFVFVSAIAGMSLRDYDASLHDDDTWWGTIYAGGLHQMNGAVVTDSTYTYGALFIDFHVDGDPRKARGYFKNVVGEVIDQFTVMTP